MNTILQALQGNKHSHSHQVDPTFQNNLQGSSLSLTNQRWCQHYYNGKFWHMPENFGFPSNPCFLRIGWHFWLKGMPNFVGIEGTKKPVMPFQRMACNQLPLKLSPKFKGEWKPIFTAMESAPNLPTSVKSNANVISHENVEKSYDIAFNHLQKNVCQFVFSNPTFKKYNDWSVGNWIKMIKRSYVMLYGTQENKNNLPHLIFYHFLLTENISSSSMWSFSSLFPTSIFNVN